MTQTAQQAKDQLQQFADPVRAQHSQRFFKTAKGEYGHTDKFIGVTVPQIRKVAKQFQALKLSQTKTLLYSPIHEHRLLALIILTGQYAKQPQDQESIVNFYLKNANQVNNWDLVDSSAHKILGPYLLDNPSKQAILKDLVLSDNLWLKRIAIISTFAFIRAGQHDWSMQLAKTLLSHDHDLTHKAVGWVLREVWKKDPKLVESFLIKNYPQIPRTTLRYTIERMPKDQRRQYLEAKF